MPKSDISTCKIKFPEEYILHLLSSCKYCFAIIVCLDRVGVAVAELIKTWKCTEFVLEIFACLNNFALKNCEFFFASSLVKIKSCVSVVLELREQRTVTIFS